MNLVDRISIDISGKLGHAVQHIFNNLGLPVPESGANAKESEFLYQGKDEYEGQSPRAILFLDRFAAVIKIDKAFYRGDNEHPLILKPAAHFQVVLENPDDKYDIEILCGIKVGLNPPKDGLLTNSDSYFLLKELEKSGIDFFDRLLPGNSGYFIGRRSARFPDGVPIVLDRKACLDSPYIQMPGQPPKLSTPLDPSNEVLFPDDFAFHQDMLIGALRHRFEQAWPGYDTPEGFSASSNPAKMQFFWDVCKGMSKPGPLQLTTTGWKGLRDNELMDNKSRKAESYGDNYERRLAMVFKELSGRF